jgi:hypothetical protein
MAKSDPALLAAALRDNLRRRKGRAVEPDPVASPVTPPTHPADPPIGRPR